MAPSQVRKLLVDHHELLKPGMGHESRPGITESVVMDISIAQHLHPVRARGLQSPPEAVGLLWIHRSKRLISEHKCPTAQHAALSSARRGQTHCMWLAVYPTSMYWRCRLDPRHICGTGWCSRRKVTCEPQRNRMAARHPSRRSTTGKGRTGDGRRCRPSGRQRLPRRRSKRSSSGGARCNSDGEALLPVKPFPCVEVCASEAPAINDPWPPVSLLEGRVRPVSQPEGRV
eukprot:scaffold41748_cov31-Tisochrysis_lutea.AAC.3